MAGAFFSYSATTADQTATTKTRMFKRNSFQWCGVPYRKILSLSEKKSSQNEHAQYNKRTP